MKIVGKNFDGFLVQMSCSELDALFNLTGDLQRLRWQTELLANSFSGGSFEPSELFRHSVRSANILPVSEEVNDKKT